MITSITSVNYHYADQVSPVCEYNTRWEKEFGVHRRLIKVIYNGVSKEVFSPGTNLDKNKYPTVVSVARIDPVKDIISLIKAAALVKEKIRDVRFIVYGSVSVPEYYEECQALVSEMDLKETFIFAGHTDNVPAAYKRGDVIALSSITEAFPYSVVEAMMTGKAIVATDVGGIKEALGESGMLVRPRQPEQLARTIITLLENNELRYNMGEEARQRALNYFTIEKVLEAYLKSYRHLSMGVEEYRSLEIRVKKQRLLSEKGYALLSIGYWEEAIAQFRQAVREVPDSPAVPVVLTEIANAFNNMGKYDLAFNELEKAEILTEMMRMEKTA